MPEIFKLINNTMIKQLELELQERLLIVEMPDNYTYNTYADKMSICNEINKPIKLIGGKWQLICKGDELTEEVANTLVKKMQVFMTPPIFFFKDYKTGFGSCTTALDSFISAIESKNFYWGENTFDKECDLLVSDNSALGCAKYRKAFHKWQKAESKTFNPSRTLIFKIS